MAAWNAGAWAATLVFGFVTSTLIFRAQGAAAFGIWATIGSLRTFLIFLDGGLTWGVTRDAARFDSDNETQIRLVAARYVYAGLAIVAVFISVALNGLPGRWLHLAPDVARTASIVTIVLGLETAVFLASSPLSATIRGRQRMDALALTSFLQATVGISLLALLVPRLGLTGAALAVLGGQLAASISRLLWVRLIMPARNVRERPTRGAFMNVVRFSAPLWVIAAGTQIGLSTDLPVVGAFYGAVAASHYALGIFLPQISVGFLFVILDVVFPRLATASDHDVHKLIHRMLAVGCALGALGLGTLMAQAPTILTAWVGTSPRLALTVLWIASVTWACNIPTHMLFLAAIGRDKHSPIAPLVLGEAGLNLALSLVLVRLTPAGPAWGTLITLAVSNLVIIPAVICGRMGISYTGLIPPVLGGYGLGLAGTLAIRWATSLLPGTAYIQVTATIGLLVVSTGVVLGAVAVGLQTGLVRRLGRWVLILLYGGPVVAIRQWREVQRARQRLRKERRSRDLAPQSTIHVPPLVTIRIATYNRGRLVADRAIASALAQDYPQIEVVVVGDHCDEATEAAVRSVTDGRVHFENLPERGKYPKNPSLRWMVAGTSPMNRGNALALGEWICPLDDDDEMLPDHVSTLLAEAQSRDLDFVYGVAEMETEPGVWQQVGSWPPRRGHIVHTAVMYSRRLAFMEYSANSWRLRQGADANLWARIRRAGARMGFVDRVVCRHYQEAPKRRAIQPHGAPENIQFGKPGRTRF